MGKLRGSVQNLSFSKLILILFVVGTIIGTMFANALKPFYYNSFTAYKEQFLTTIQAIHIDNLELFRMAIINHVKEYFLIWVISVTILGTPYIIYRDLYKGFMFGFLLSLATMEYGFKGIGVFFMYLIPHYVIYIPVFYCTLLKVHELNKRINGKGSVSGIKKSVLLSYVPIFCIMLVLLVLGSLLESFVGSNLIIKFLLLVEES